MPKKYERLFALLKRHRHHHIQLVEDRENNVVFHCVDCVYKELIPARKKKA